MTELLPCPFCGGKAVSISGAHSWIECASCCAKSTIARNSDVAAERWNRRAPAEALQPCTIDGVTYDRVPRDLYGEPAFLADGGQNPAYRWPRSRKNSRSVAGAIAKGLMRRAKSGGE